MSGSFALAPGAGKAALDALTDQSFAAIREQRREADPDLVRLAADFAGMIAEQFAGSEALAARVLMASVQLMAALAERLDNPDEVHVTADIMALAAEQLSRAADL